MKFYIKKGIFPFVYMIFMSIIALSIAAIKDLVWLKVILAVLNIAFYAVIIAAVSFKDGQEAMKIQFANDLERKEIIRTGEDRPLKIHEEYKPWKGFVFGFFTCAPLLILLIFHTIIYLITGSYTGLGAVSALIYFMFFIFFTFNNVNGAGTTGFVWYAYYGSLIALPVLILLIGITYILGAKKIRLQREIINEKQRKIYGDKF